MNSLSTLELLTVWELGLNRGQVERALALLVAACPQVSRQQLANLSLGQRDRKLLKLRETTFGSEMSCLMVCPACDERLELTVKISELLSEPQEPTRSSLQLTVDDYDVEFRLPNSEDLLVLSSEHQLLQRPLALLERCLLSAKRRSESVSANELPVAVLDAVEHSMEQADPLADICFTATCPACSQNCQRIFDVVSFFWRELDTWAARIMRDVCTLASAFGWSERDILAMSPIRRQFYLERLAG